MKKLGVYTTDKHLVTMFISVVIAQLLCISYLKFGIPIIDYAARIAVVIAMIMAVIGVVLVIKEIGEEDEEGAE